MGFINHIPILKGDNYGEWIKKIDLAFVCGEVNKIIKEPKPTEPPAPVRETDKTDADWQKKQKDCSLKDVIWFIKCKVKQCQQEMYGGHKEHNWA